MTHEDRLLCLCARQEFLTGHRRAVEELCRGAAVRWSRLAAAAERHGVLPIVGANLRTCDAGLPEDLAVRCELAVLENAAVRERDADRLADGLARLREVELEAMLLKGTALALSVYAEPWVVTSQDIDLVLRPTGPGWAKGKGREKEVRRALYTNGVECDLETHHDVTMNGVLPVDFARIWREARPVGFRGVPAWRMSPEDLLISLCVNCCRKRFRLKGVFDVAETLRRGEPLDQGRLGVLAREGRCEGIVYAALVVARGALGAGLPAGFLEPLGVSPVRAALLRSLAAAFLGAAPFTGRSGRPLALALAYASLRPAEAWRSVRYSLTHPDKHKGEDPQAPAQAAVAGS
ncbi:MAG: nucleotidyltransferase family protein [Thermoanaerobaculia bacterium]